MRPANYLGEQPFDLFAVEMAASKAVQLEAFLLAQVGKKYDFKAILNMGVFTSDVTSPKRWFCSELVFAALARVGVQLLRSTLHEADRVTPRDCAVSEMAELVFSSDFNGKLKKGIGNALAR